MTTVSCDHVDTCLSCYVLDHCNGEDELLLGVPVDGASTLKEVWESLIDELQVYELPEGMTYDAARAAIAELFEGRKMDKLFDARLDVPSDDEDEDGEFFDDGEECYAWFRLSVDGEDDDDGEDDE